MTITRLAQYTAETRILTDLAYLINLPAIVSDIKYTGSYSYRLAVNNGPFGYSIVPGRSAMRFGWWQYMVSSDVSNTAYLCYISNAGAQGLGIEQLHLKLDIGTSQVQLRRPAVGDYEVLDSFTLPVEYTTTGAWFHIGYVVKIDETDGFFSVYIDGEQVFTYVGDTRLSKVVSSIKTYSSSAILWLGPGGASDSFGLQGWHDTRMDDMFFEDITAETDNPVPARRFLMSLPTGAGIDAEWTPSTGSNWQNVDDNPNDAGATYNKALDPDLRDTFVMSDIVIPADHAIVAYIPSPFARRLDSEVNSDLSVHAHDGVDYQDSPDLDLTMSYNRPVFYRFTTMPDASEITEAGFNALQFGYQSRGDV